MSEQLPDTDRNIPRVIMAQRVIDKIWRGALLHPGVETGESMIGLVVPQTGRQEPDIYILDTLSPDAHTVREWGMFERGSDWLGDVLQWLHVNWNAFRELRRPSYGHALAAKWDVPLIYVGDWHKQPGAMTAPSGGDAETVRAMLNDSETPEEHIVAPIVTIYPLKTQSPALENPPPSEEPVQEKTLAEEILAEKTAGAEDDSDHAAEETVSEDNDYLPAWALTHTAEEEQVRIRIDFWYMSKRAKRFVPVTPVIWPNEQLPELPAVAWHLVHSQRFDQEYALLADARYAVDVVRWDADGKPPYEICFSVYKPGNDHVILLVTAVDYPAQVPAVRIAPLVTVAEHEDVFDKLYEASKPVQLTQMPEWEWDSKRTLIELVWHIEKTLKKEETS